VFIRFRLQVPRSPNELLLSRYLQKWRSRRCYTKHETNFGRRIYHGRQIWKIDAAAMNHQAFYLAAENGHLNILRWLVETCHEDPCQDGRFPMILAIRYGHRDVVEFLKNYIPLSSWSELENYGIRELPEFLSTQDIPGVPTQGKMSDSGVGCHNDPESPTFLGEFSIVDLSHENLEELQ